MDHRAIWRWVQADGDQELRRRAEHVEAMFGDGQAPPRPERPVPDRLTVAVDATGIRLIEGEGASVELAVSFTGTEQVGGTRRRPVDRHVFADTCEPDPFGRALAHELERTDGAHRIGACMLLADGETWIENLAGDWLPSARYRCDHFHPAVKIRGFCDREEQRFRRMLRRAFASPHRLAAELLRALAGGSGQGPGSSRSTSGTTAATCTPAARWAPGSGCTARPRPRSTSSSP